MTHKMSSSASWSSPGPSSLLTSPLFSCLAFHFSTLSFHSPLLSTSFSPSKSLPATAQNPNELNLKKSMKRKKKLGNEDHEIFLGSLPLPANEENATTLGCHWRVWSPFSCKFISSPYKCIIHPLMGKLWCKTYPIGLCLNPVYIVIGTPKTSPKPTNLQHMTGPTGSPRIQKARPRPWYQLG